MSKKLLIIVNAVLFIIAFAIFLVPPVNILGTVLNNILGQSLSTSILETLIRACAVIVSCCFFIFSVSIYRFSSISISQRSKILFFLIKNIFYF